MAANNRTRKGKATLDVVLPTVERGFAAAADDIADIKSKMATKDDIARLDTRIDKLDAKIDSVESNLAGKIARLGTKLSKFEDREIDKRLQLEVRVSAIEKHLGLDKKIAA
jgi:septal ring factor EnvC (AmiA/AmiB activator)